MSWQVGFAGGDGVLPVIARLAGEYEQAALLQQMRLFFSGGSVGEIHDAGRAEAEGCDGVAEAWHAIDMCGDALAGLVFVDDDLIGRAGENALRAQALAEFGQPIRDSADA